jgi:hypothetical protein
MTNELGERRDLKEERDHEEYLAMCDQVRDEMVMAAEYEGFQPNSGNVHREAMRRLREKYESACGE